MSEHPIVSVIMPLYNKASYVRFAIDSVLAQTVKEWELCIVNNGSNDGGDAIVQEYSDPRIRLLEYSLRTGGPGAPRNFGLKHSSGHWVLFLDADDLIDSNHLENLLQTAGSNPNAAIIAGHWLEYLEKAPDRLTLMRPMGYGQKTTDRWSSAIAFAPWAVHAALVKREILQGFYTWIEDLDPYLSEDTAFWFRLVSKYPVVYSPSQGALYRRVASGRDQHDHPTKWFHGIKAVTESNLKFLHQQSIPLTAKHCENLMRCYSNIYLLARRYGDEKTSQESLKLAQYWLEKCAMLDGINSFSLKIRQIFKLKHFLPLIELVS